MVDQVAEPRSGDRDFITLAMLITADACRPFGGCREKGLLRASVNILCVSVVKLL